MPHFENTTHPLRDNYTGPLKGFFTCIHHAHETAFEWSEDITPRRADIESGRADKPAWQLEDRRAACVYLSPEKFPMLYIQCEKAWEKALEAWEKAWEAREKAWEAREKAWEKAREKALEAWEKAREKAWEKALEAREAYKSSYPDEYQKIIALIAEQGITWTEGKGINWRNPQ